MKDLKEVVKLGISLANALGKSLEDGKVDYGDLINLWPVITDLGDAVAGIDAAYKEFKSLDAAGLGELSAYVKQEFDIPQEHVEVIIESAVELISSVLRTYLLSKKPA